MKKTKETKEEKLLKLGNAPILKLLVVTSLENIISLLSLSLYSFVDSIFIGRTLGEQALAAISVFQPVEYLLLTSLPVAFSVASTTLSSPMIGHGDIKGANHVSSQLFMFGLIYSILIPLLLIFWIRPLVKMLGAATETAIKYAVQYASVMVFSTLVYFPNGGYLPLLRAENRANVAMYIQLTSSAINVVLDAILFPTVGKRLELYTPTISTVGSLLVTAVYTLLSFFGVLKQGVLRFIAREMKPDGRIYGIFLKQAFPQFLNAVPNCLFIILANTQIKRYATSLDEADRLSAGIGSYNRVNSLILQPRQAVYLAFMSIVGYNLGQKSYKRVRSLLITTFWVHIILVAVLAAIGIGAAHPLVLLFGGSEEFIKQSVLTLRLAVFGTPFGGCLMECSGIYQMEKRPAMASMFQLSRVVLGTVLIMVFPLVFGIEYIAVCFSITDILTGGASFLVFWLSIQRKYARLEVQQEQEAQAAVYITQEPSQVSAQEAVAGVAAPDAHGGVGKHEIA